MKTRYLSILVVALFIVVSQTTAVELNQSILDRAQQSLHYSTVLANQDRVSYQDAQYQYSDNDQAKSSGSKSPAKAFIFSMILPGAGQYYAGSKIKPVAYLGIEVASWAFYSKWQSDGNTMTDDFEQFSRDHWSEADYTQFIEWTYGESDDEAITASEMSHHLPDTRTQQYYEMTGKYNQFAWGWDDADLYGRTLQTYNISDPPPRVVSDSLTPVSANRDAYEQMRKDADDRYNRATRMIYVSMVNHLVSAFEAFIMVKKQNGKRESSLTSLLERTDMRASLRTLNAEYDTPFMTLSYNF